MDGGIKEIAEGANVVITVFAVGNVVEGGCRDVSLRPQPGIVSKFRHIPVNISPYHISPAHKVERKGASDGRNPSEGVIIIQKRRKKAIGARHEFDSDMKDFSFVRKNRRLVGLKLLSGFVEDHAVPLVDGVRILSEAVQGFEIENRVIEPFAAEKGGNYTEDDCYQF